MGKARLKVWYMGTKTELHVILADQLWTQGYSTFRDALDFAIAHTWVTAGEVAHLHANMPHLKWEGRFDTTPDSLRTIGFQRQGQWGGDPDLAR